jgi:hypothetical protein
MPVDFLTEEQKAGYGQFSGEPNETQLARYFLLDEADQAFISERRGEQNRFGFGLQITVARFLGTFFAELAVVPVNVQIFVANQLSISNIKVLEDYAKRETTRREHTALIRKRYGYHDFRSPPWSFRLSRLLYSRAWISNERPSLMFDFATAWLIQHKVLLPGASTLSRLISEVRERASNRLWLRLSSLPTAEPTRKNACKRLAYVFVPLGFRPLVQNPLKLQNKMAMLLMRVVSGILISSTTSISASLPLFGNTR